MTDSLRPELPTPGSLRDQMAPQYQVRPHREFSDQWVVVDTARLDAEAAMAYSIQTAQAIAEAMNRADTRFSAIQREPGAHTQVEALDAGVLETLGDVMASSITQLYDHAKADRLSDPEDVFWLIDIVMRIQSESNRLREWQRIVADALGVSDGPDESGPWRCADAPYAWRVVGDLRKSRNFLRETLDAVAELISLRSGMGVYPYGHERGAWFSERDIREALGADDDDAEDGA